VEYGYPRDAMLQYLNKNELNSATCAYWLLQMAAEHEKTCEDVPNTVSAFAANKPAGRGQQRKQKSATVSEH